MASKNSRKTFTTTILGEGNMSGFEVPFDPATVFGKVRAPVKVTIKGHTYRSTIAVMDGKRLVPLRTSHREAAGVERGDRVSVSLELDTDARVVTPPADFAKALKAALPAWERWTELSFTHQKEYADAIEGAKKPETRARRIAKAVEAIGARPAKVRRS